MNDVLRLMLEGEALSPVQMAKVLGKDVAAIETELAQLKAEGTLLGWRPVLHPQAAAADQVRAVIEVKVTPEREGGFDRTAERVSRFAEVESCYLMSGGFDLLVVVRGPTLLDIARFVSEKLATIPGVVSTASHFQLRAYKESGYEIPRDRRDPDKPSVSP